MKQLTFRLKPGQYLKEEIEKIAVEKEIKAGVLLSIVGGLENAILRMAASEPDNQIVKEWDEPFEIVSGTGTISKEGCHIHISVSDKQGKVIGGHLKDGCEIKYTAEIVIGIFDDVSYERVFDENTGFKELEVK
ncbi:MAG: DNA-binding protein [Candidatus Moranbacteria bacterium]|nr:DNA-binding protein [Candidatus Moranbacteria bacterium]MDD3965009.1 DNA-binding protein [Candidatus Moranbacteria bacterium]